ncbi:hypothetical protein M316_0132 [Nitrincola phage 1M3-16]|uniref:head scaffolding protein n=1 Tax=Nitrincola phage 1M3-16 TaxID=1472912 RepID=UPI000444CCAD|nr:head scaffolding protein [Nitrincola phage 1M3-16]AHX01197.1 hypothetical protein M316_0132 [Nitrincola phage 1M3-16]
MTTETNERDANIVEETTQQKTVQETAKETTKDSPSKPSKVEIDIEELERMRNALSKVNEEAKQRRLALKQYEEMGFTPEKAKEMLEAQRNAELKEMEEQQRYQEMLERERQERLAEKEALEGKLTEYEKRMQKQARKRVVAEAVAKHQADMELLAHHIEKRTATVEDEDSGEYNVVVLDTKGNIMEGKTLDDLMAEFKEHPSLSKGFPSPGKKGTGMSSEGTAGEKSGAGIPRTSKQELMADTAKQREFISKYGWEAYNKLPFSR